MPIMLSHTVGPATPTIEGQCDQRAESWYQVVIRDQKQGIHGSVQVGDGKSTLFWTDRWIEDRGSIAEIAPCLLQAVGPRIRKKRTIQEGFAR